MCLIGKEGYGFGVVKDKPIEAYKVLIERDGDLFSPVRAFRYRMGETYEEMLGAISDYSIDGFPVYDKGFHMLNTIEGAIQYLNNIEKFISIYDYLTNRIAPTFLTIVKCLIPPTTDGIDTIYVTGEDGDYGIPCTISNRIRIVEVVSRQEIRNRMKLVNLKPFHA
jgi:hypothetical protein